MNFFLSDLSFSSGVLPLHFLHVRHKEQMSLIFKGKIMSQFIKKKMAKNPMEINPNFSSLLGLSEFMNWNRIRLNTRRKISFTLLKKLITLLLKGLYFSWYLLTQ